MEVKVLSYNKAEDYHECTVEGHSVPKYIDMTTNGDFKAINGLIGSDEYDSFNEGLVGRKFEVDSLDSYISFACGITEIEPSKD